MRVLGIALLVPALALGTTLVVDRTVAERARLFADRVVLAQVLDTRTVIENGDARRMKTFTTVAVGEDWKGSGPGTIEIVQLGGSYGLYEAHLPGDARFQRGETAVLLLRCPANLGGRCVLVTLGEGKVNVVGDEAFTFQINGNRWTKRKLSELKAEIKAAVALGPNAPAPAVTPKVTK